MCSNVELVLPLWSGRVVVKYFRAMLNIFLFDVVRWELYDTIYTERYMGRPIDNPSGYNSSTPLWRLENVRNKKYYLIHGTHDDNVHYQQSMLLSAALEEKYILFRQQAYPDQDHSIGDFHHHLYLSLTSFFNEDCFGALST